MMFCHMPCSMAFFVISLDGELEGFQAILSQPTGDECQARVIRIDGKLISCKYRSETNLIIQLCREKQTMNLQVIPNYK